MKWQIRQRTPFKEKGRNFQDAVICLAAIDDLVASGDKVGAFVSGDNILSQDVFDGLCKKVGVKVILFDSVDRLYQDLNRLLSAAEMHLWQMERDLAAHAVRAYSTKIGEFVETNLEIPRSLGGSNWIVELGRIELAEIAAADTPIPWEIKPGNITTISADLKLNVHAIVHRQIVTSATVVVIKVGVPAQRSFVGSQPRSNRRFW